MPRVELDIETSVPPERVRSASIRPHGSGSRIHVVWNRTPISLSGRLGMLLVTGTRGAPIRASLKRGLKRLGG